ncbi:hypothetical protein F2P79_004129 [Pimephales promelas]|nr:hypothetical protein F2P79_004129 [Pimephales promelas]
MCSVLPVNAFTIFDQSSLSSVACPIRADEAQRPAGRCWSSCRPQLRELHWAFVPTSAWLYRPAGRWHQAAGSSPNYNYQLQLQMETSRRDGPCILYGLHQPPQSALKSLNRPAARTNHHTLHQLLKHGANEKAPTNYNLLIIYKPCSNHTPQLGNSDHLILARWLNYLQQGTGPRDSQHSLLQPAKASPSWAPVAWGLKPEAQAPSCSVYPSLGPV